jgi:hypothetical protein
VCREEIEKGMKIELKDLNPCVKKRHMREESLGVTCTKETDGGRKLGGCVQKGDG